MNRSVNVRFSGGREGRINLDTVPDEHKRCFHGVAQDGTTVESIVVVDIPDCLDVVITNTDPLKGHTVVSRQEYEVFLAQHG